MAGQSVDTKCGSVQVRLATPDEVVDLRHAMLRAGLPRETAVFSGDDHPESRHVVALSSDGRVVGCSTVHLSTWESESAWQLRGMATDPDVRGAGVGRAMINYLERVLRDDTPVRQMWCNARVPAVGFYERLGWRVVSEQFEIPSAGPHVKMTKLL